ncbi:MAG: hypothetical protein M0R06_07500 [Sphaerochaeta sp.]|jgi:hypothetical protein|nr:hypothetical protein [Sphaerochaeta sp.]
MADITKVTVRIETKFSFSNTPEADAISQAWETFKRELREGQGIEHVEFIVDYCEDDEHEG